MRRPKDVNARVRSARVKLRPIRPVKTYAHGEILGGPGISKADAELVNRVSGDRIRKGDGSFVPKTLLELSRPKNSPTHYLFEWNDGKAAEIQRLTQAASLIRAVRVFVIPDGQKKGQIIRKFVKIREGETRHYADIHEVLPDAENRQRLLEDALRELETFQRKYANLRELVSVFEEIDAVLKKKRRS
jgi:hypothetical protein